MKKFLTLLLAVALVMSLSVPAFATEYDETDTEATTNLSFSLLAAPTYTVTIPGSLNLVEGNNYLPITVSDSADLDGGSIVITAEETNDPHGTPDNWVQRLVVGGGESASDYINYHINNIDLNDYVFTSGTEIFSFTADGTQNVILNIKALTNMAQPTETYTGFLTFGIAYEPATP